MSKSKGGFSDYLFNKFMPMLYGLGAAVVIIGAMFKIMHWPFAGPMLVVGLSTEAIIFAFSAFQPIHKDPDWARVYPQLADDYDGYDDEDEATGTSVTKKLDEMMADANINQDVISRLGSGLSS
ncbi:MAG: gliding motility protein GldL, partial [Cytophagaceae bacterium]